MRNRILVYLARIGLAALIAGILATSYGLPVAYAQDDVEEANKTIVTRFFQELINDHNVDVIDELIAPGYVEHFAYGDFTYDDPQVLKDEWEGIIADMSPAVTIDDMMADGDRVVTSFTGSANDGEVEWTGITIQRIEDGKIVEFWEQSDQLGLMTQMGMIPDTATQDANKEALRQLVEAYNAGDAEEAASYYAPGYVYHNIEGTTVYTTEEDILAYAEEGSSDVNITPEEILADGDKVVARYTLALQDEQIEADGINIFKFVDGKIVEEWEQLDMLALLSGFGLLPPIEDLMSQAMGEPETLATGFTSPQGVLVDADGNVWVIDGGTGGDTQVDWFNPDSEQVEPAMMGDTAQIVRIEPDGTQTVVANLPSVATGTDFIGGARLAVLDGELYATSGQWLGDLGEDRLDLAGVVAHVSSDGSVEEAGVVFDAEKADNPDGHVVDSHPYGLAAGPDGLLWVADAGANALFTVDPTTGDVNPVTAFEGIPGPLPNPDRGGAMESDPVPTGVAFGDDGTTYVSLLSGFPFVPGSAKVVAVDEDGMVSDYATGLTMLTDLRPGPDGELYAVQFGLFTEQGPTPDSGAIIRIHEGDASEVVYDGLSFPTSIDFNEAGDAFVTVNGVGAPGSGELIMIPGLTGNEGVPISEAMQTESE